MAAFTGQVAIVTGASSGIGKAITLGLAAQGAALCLVGRNAETLEAIAGSAGKTATRLLHYRVDLTVDETFWSWQRMSSEISAPLTFSYTVPA